MNIQIYGIEEKDAMHTMFYHLRIACALFENTPLDIVVPDDFGIAGPAVTAFLDALNKAYADD